MTLDAPRTGRDLPAMALDTPRTGTLPLLGVFQEQRGKLVVNWTSCATFFRPIPPPSRGLGLSFENKAPGQLKASWIILKNGSAQLAQLTTKWRGHGIWRGCGRGRVIRLALPPALSLHSPPHLHPAPPTLFLLRRDRALRPAFAWDRGRVIHLILASSSSGMVRSASMRSQHLLRRNLNLHLWIPQLVPATIKKPNRTGAIRQKGIRLLYEGELWHQYQHLACRVAS